MRNQLATTIGISFCLLSCQASQPTRTADVVDLPAVDITTLSTLLAPDETLQILTFPDVGSMTVSAAIRGDGTTTYAVPVAKGQTFSTTLVSTDAAAYFDLLDAAGTRVFQGETGGRRAEVIASEATTYLIIPRLPLAMAGPVEPTQVAIEVARGAPAPTD